MNALLTFFIVLYAIVCVLLILLVIIQGGRAEGLFASAQANVLGSRGTDVLTRMTRVLSGIFIVGALLISIFISTQRSALDTQGSDMGVATPAAPATEGNALEETEAGESSEEPLNTADTVE